MQRLALHAADGTEQKSSGNESGQILISNNANTTNSTIDFHVIVVKIAQPVPEFSVPGLSTCICNFVLCKES